MSTQTPNPHPAYAMPAPAPSKPFYRPSQGRMLGGVCAAVADRFGWDRTLVRVVTVASVLLPGPQVVAYVAAWILIPDEQRYWERQAAAAAPYPAQHHPAAPSGTYPTDPPASPQA
ncbi:PspC domain-containing protein [Xylanimonas protaetiae]|uniref:PspC domain-containing protein n=1 Tax=Xylanimonas protaetiae TaxID=2509457 RepID=A0A4P6F227_9MICO|nr:PspC domain-containing protein [Xylanimonas protaetiae]QAY69582.1 PspC domain-containing protein [Xylanimonas protaetiae]